MRLAVPMLGKTVCEHFGRCDGLWLAEVNLASRTCTRPRRLVRPRPRCDTLADWLVELGVGCLLCHAIGPQARRHLAGQGIRVVTGLSGNSPMELVEQFMQSSTANGPNPCLDLPHVRRHCRGR